MGWRDTITKIGEGIATAADNFDSITGAPARKAVDAALAGENPVTAFKDQFAMPTETAPSGSEIAEKRLGISNQPRPMRDAFDQEIEGAPDLPSGASMVGAGIDLAADPLNAAPLIGPAAKGAGKALPNFMRGLRDLGEAGAVGNRALDMSEAARLARAKKLGFDTTKKYYHGTASGPFDEFAHSNTDGVTAFFTQDQGFADKFANDPFYNQRGIVAEGDETPHVFETYLKAKNTFDYSDPKHLEKVVKKLSKDDAKEVVHSLELSPFDRSMALAELAEGRVPAKLHDAMRFGDNWATLENPKILGAIKKAGFDSTFVQEEGRKNIAVFKPDQIRSVNAAFDPAKKKSGNILAGGAAALGVAGLGNEAQATDRNPMSGGGWRDTITHEASEQPQSGGGWRNTIEHTAEQPSMGESAARGGTQGATLGFADELSGALGALGEKVGGMFTEGLGDKSLGDTYREYRDAYRKDDASAKAANPGTFGASSVAGGMLPLAATGGSTAALTATGAAQGFGSSDADSLGGMARDTAIGGATGFGAAKIAQGVKGLIPTRSAGTQTVSVTDSGLTPSGVSTGGLFPGVPKKVVTNVPGGATSLGGRVLEGVAESATLKKASELFNIGGRFGNLGRLGAYTVNPLTAKSQAVSDGIKVAQSGAKYLLEHAPEKLGKYAQVLSSAAARGGSALATTEFLLSKTDPEYQEIMKKHRESQ